MIMMMAFATLSHCTHLIVLHLTTFLMSQVIFALTHVYYQGKLFLAT